MLSIEEQMEATRALSTEEDSPSAVESTGLVDAADKADPNSDATPLEALRRVIRESFELARRLPTGNVLSLGGTEVGRSKCEADLASAFETLSSHVRAAQRAGALRSGEASTITALIVSTMLGAADIVRAKPGMGVNDADFPFALLLDLLATKDYN